MPRPRMGKPEEKGGGTKPRRTFSCLDSDSGVDGAADPDPLPLLLTPQPATFALLLALQTPAVQIEVSDDRPFAALLTLKRLPVQTLVPGQGPAQLPAILRILSDREPGGDSKRDAEHQQCNRCSYHDCLRLLDAMVETPVQRARSSGAHNHGLGYGPPTSLRRGVSQAETAFRTLQFGTASRSAISFKAFQRS